MGKLALLIGVSEYESGLPALPKAVRDVEKLAQILQNPEIGGFDKVEVLKDPDRQTMADRMYEFFASAKKDDLVLLFFSGHGVISEFGNFHLTSRSTRKQQDQLIPTTAISAAEIQGWMGSSRSRRQLIILDCCFAGAFAKGMTAKGEEKIDLRSQLGGEGRTILTAATSTQYAFEQEGLELSIYSHYLVEGLEKGAADLDNDGQISVEELHEYVFKKVKEAAPAMTPEIYNLARDTEPILIARSPKDKPVLKYRKAVEARCDQGRFSIPARKLLDRMRSELQIASDIAEAIEAEVLQPWRERERKLQDYRETLEEATKAENPLSDRTLKDLQDYQQYLGLRDEDVQAIHAELLPAITLAEPLVISEPVKSEPVSSKSAPPDDLASEKEIDYTKLRDLLGTGDWKAADRETYLVMLQAVGRKEGDYLRPDALKNFPCQDLKTIDSLWVKYSNGHFGFSVQKKIWQECGSPTDAGEKWDRFCVKVGWQNQQATKYVSYDKLKFDLQKSPAGELPAQWCSVVGGGGRNLFSRAETCRL